WYKMAALIQSGLDLSPIITHRFSIDDFQKGFDAMRSGQSGKVGLIPQHCSLKRTVGIGVRAGRKIQLKLIEIYRLSVEVGQRKG
ncbi:hypothetical protein MJL48_32805, partial [Salmonella enterica subsp. enterica serovar Kentucky]|nr:hypothetical protein [Salmonella enterica subsp. enterica serovar Kentucky]